MKIHDFDTKRGIYSFEFEDLETENHAHPAVEIINATNGTFSLQSNGKTSQNLVFALIDSNTEHSVEAKNCSVRLLMIESHNFEFHDFLDRQGIALQNGIFHKTSFAEKDELFALTKQVALETDLKTPADLRIAESIRFIQENKLEYKNLLSELTAKVCLSDSRLSHLFKQHIGISLKKYLVWNKLRRAITLYLREHSNLTHVSLQSGFFDQAHLTHSFKRTLGISPSKAYNSRIIQ